MMMTQRISRRIMNVLWVLIGALAVVYGAQQPIRNLSVTFMGKNYEVADVVTVEDVQKKFKEASGLGLDGKLMYNGNILDTPTTYLSEAGIPTEGGTVIVIPAGLPTKDEMEQYLEGAGISKEKLDEMMKMFSGGNGGEGGAMPSLEDSMKAMTDVMNSPLFQEMMSDPAKLEQSRQMILNNPLLKGMMGSMPGMEDLLNDEVAWRQAMQAAADLYKNMDPTELMNSMLGGAAGAAGAGANSFMNLDMLGNADAASSSSATKALEELDEDD